MATTRLTPNHIETRHPVSSEVLKNAFEAAVCEIHQPQGSVDKKLNYRAPIVSRARVLGSSQTEKRALSDAARALAQLWKV